MNASPAAALGFASFAALTSVVMRRRAAAHARRYYPGTGGAPRAAKRPHAVPFGAVAGEDRGPKPMQDKKESHVYVFRKDERSSGYPGSLPHALSS